jgi:hypothetical protein
VIEEVGRTFKYKVLLNNRKYSDWSTASYDSGQSIVFNLDYTDFFMGSNSVVVLYKDDLDNIGSISPYTITRVPTEMISPTEILHGEVRISWKPLILPNTDSFIKLTIYKDSNYLTEITGINTTYYDDIGVSDGEHTYSLSVTLEHNASSPNIQIDLDLADASLFSTPLTSKTSIDASGVYAFNMKPSITQEFNSSSGFTFSSGYITISGGSLKLSVPYTTNAQTALLPAIDTSNIGSISSIELTGDIADIGDNIVDDMSTISSLGSGTLYKSDPFINRIVSLSMDTETPTLTVGIIKSKVRFAVSFDNITYKVYNGTWSTVNTSNLSEFISNGMTGTQLSSADWSSSGLVKGSLYIKVCIQNNQTYYTPSLDTLKINLSSTYEIGSDYITTLTGMSLDTVDWETLIRLDGNGDELPAFVITQTTPSNTDIRYAFSNDSRTSWKVFSGGIWTGININSLMSSGMTKAQVDAVLSTQWKTLLRDSLDIAMGISSSNGGVTPSVDSIALYYRQVSTPLIPTPLPYTLTIPVIGFRYSLVNSSSEIFNEAYKLRLAQGIGFDDAEVDYDLYTTPDRIQLRSLDLGEIIGGRFSNEYYYEVVNGYVQNYTISLKAGMGAGETKTSPDGTHALLPDTADDYDKTRVFMHTVTTYDSNGDEVIGLNSTATVYPLVFTLPAEGKVKVSLKVLPTINTAGATSFQVLLTATPI